MEKLIPFERSSNNRKFIQYQDMIAKLLPNQHIKKSKDDHILTTSITFQVTDACNLCCSYCYQTNKGTRKMSFDTAKLFIDNLFLGKYDNYINPKVSPGIVLDFIGGEPLLEIDLIDKIVDYFLEKAILLRHQWATYFIVSMCSNGVLYREENVQKFLTKHKNRISFSITLDGNKELHDACRVFKDGSGSYDLAYDACNDWMSRGYSLGSKITIAQENLDYLVDAMKHMISMNYKDIHANCVYEADWTNEDGLKLYNQMKIISDYLLDNDINDTYISLYEPTFFRPKHEEDLNNWCGGTGMMLSIDPDGVLFPCIRYMESSLGDTIERYSVGNTEDGIGGTKVFDDRLKCLKCVNRRTESTDECFYCPIADGCSWCSAYNYQVYGTPDSRVTKICVMHKARCLANAYYWNRLFIEKNYDVYFKINLPDDLALEIISKEELDILKELEYKAMNRNGVKEINRKEEVHDDFGI